MSTISISSLFRLRQRQIASEDDASSHNRVDCSADIGSDIGKGAAALNTLRWNNGTLGCQSIYDNMHNQARPGAGNDESPCHPPWLGDSRLAVWNHPLPVSGD